MDQKLHNEISETSGFHRSPISRTIDVHPATPLAVNGMRTFEIDKTANKECVLRPIPNRYKGFYSVIKIREEVVENVIHHIKTRFFVIHGDKFVRVSYDMREMNRYRGQIAHATCSLGWIEEVNVYRTPVNARKCGIGTVLAELCMMDPDINANEVADSDNRWENNYVITSLNSFKEWVPLAGELKVELEKTCIKLVGMDMDVNCKGGAHAFFSAAIRLGYDRLSVMEKNYAGHGRGEWTGHFNHFNTRVAKENYVETTG